MLLLLITPFFALFAVCPVALAVNCTVTVTLRDSYGDGNSGWGSIGQRQLDPFSEGSTLVQGPYVLSNTDRPLAFQYTSDIFFYETSYEIDIVNHADGDESHDLSGAMKDPSVGGSSGGASSAATYVSLGSHCSECGDGFRDGDEDCDDGNSLSGDGCDAGCDVEAGFECAPGGSTSSGSSTDVCLAIVCGDGRRFGASETCDDGNTDPGDGCSASCAVEDGFSCTGGGFNTSDTCVVAVCGDGVRAPSEDCDDGNATPGDGCSPLCEVEPGYACKGGTFNTPDRCLQTSCQATLIIRSVAGTNLGTGTFAGREVKMTGPTSGATLFSFGPYDLTGHDAPMRFTFASDSRFASTEYQVNIDNVPYCGGGMTTKSSAVYCDFADACPFCGDGRRGSLTGTNVAGEESAAESEACDDGNAIAGDGCSPLCRVEANHACFQQQGELHADALARETGGVCRLPVCGDGGRWGAEECDDGDTDDGDGCSSSCEIESGFGCGLGTQDQPDLCRASVCGDGFVAGAAEECDDGNTDPGDGCGAFCEVEVGHACLYGNVNAASQCFPKVCGDGIRAGESCDDGNINPGDGCSPQCEVETGYACVGGSPTSADTCAEVCGDGLRVGGESCDDGNTARLDGCDDSCEVENGNVCAGGNITTADACVPVCGDGIVVPREACDDGNDATGDGCDPTCREELQGVFPRASSLHAGGPRGNENICALMSGPLGLLKCWGANRLSSIGIGTSTQQGISTDRMGDGLSAVEVVPPAPGATIKDTCVFPYLGSTGTTTCTRYSSGHVVCWGVAIVEAGLMQCTAGSLRCVASHGHTLELPGGATAERIACAAGGLLIWTSDLRVVYTMGHINVAAEPVPAGTYIDFPRGIDINVISGHREWCALYIDGTAECTAPVLGDFTSAPGTTRAVSFTEGGHNPGLEITGVVVSGAVPEAATTQQSAVGLGACFTFGDNTVRCVGSNYYGLPAQSGAPPSAPASLSTAGLGVAGFTCPPLTEPLSLTTEGTLAINQYEDNAECAWVIEAPEGKVVRVTIAGINTESCCDKVFILDGETFAGDLLTSASGTIQQNGGGTQSVVTTSKHATIVFTSDVDNNLNFEGYVTLTYVFEDAPVPFVCPPSGDPDTTFDYSGYAGDISTVSETLVSRGYTSDQSCGWLLKAPAGFVPRVEVTYLNMAIGGDFVALVQSPGASADDVIMSLTGSAIQPAVGSVFTSGNAEAGVLLESDSFSEPGELGGFDLKVTFVPTAQAGAPVPFVCPSAGDAVVVGNGGTVEAFNYGDDASCEWTLAMAPVGAHIEITYTYLFTEEAFDKVWVESAPPNTTFAERSGGTGAVFDAPALYVTTLRAGKVRFTSDAGVNMGTYGGFRAVVSHVCNDGTNNCFTTRRRRLRFAAREEAFEDVMGEEPVAGGNDEIYESFAANPARDGEDTPPPKSSAHGVSGSKNPFRFGSKSTIRAGSGSTRRLSLWDPRRWRKLMRFSSASPPNTPRASKTLTGKKKKGAAMSFYQSRMKKRLPRGWTPGPHPGGIGVGGGGGRGGRGRASGVVDSNSLSFTSPAKKSRETTSSSQITPGGRRLLGEEGDGYIGAQPAVGVAATHYYGDGDAEELSEMLPVSFGGNTTRPVIKLAVGDHACAILDGPEELWCWGRRDYHGCGHVTTSPHVPVRVALGTGDIPADVIVTASSTCVLLTTGRVKCFGLNLRGQLGSDSEEIGEEESELGDALDTVDLTSTVVSQVSLNTFHTCFVLNGGIVKCVGTEEDNVSVGAFRPSEMYNKLDPIDVGVLVDSVAAGTTVCAVTRVHASIVCWGLNTNDVLGTDDAPQPGSARGAAKIDLGGSGDTRYAAVTCTADVVTTSHKSCCAVTELAWGGQVKCWGLDLTRAGGIAFKPFLGGLSDTVAVTNWRKGEVDPIPFSNPVKSMCMGTGHLCTLSVEGHVECVGYGFFTGDEIATGDEPLHFSIPTPFFNDPDLRASHLSCGKETTCIVTQDGASLICSHSFSGNFTRSLASALRVSLDEITVANSGGSGTVAGGGAPPNTITTVGEVTSLAVSSDEVCIALRSGAYHSLRCLTFSGTTVMYLSEGKIQKLQDDDAWPDIALGYATPIAAVSAAGATTRIAILSLSGTARLLGSNTNGELGIASSADLFSAEPGVMGISLPIAAVTECPGGQYAGEKAVRCVDCPQGTYRRPYGTISSPGYTVAGADRIQRSPSLTCDQCPAGTYSTRKGAMDASACQACPAGTASGVGAKACTKCNPGQASSAGASVCTNCAPGTYQLFEGSATCLPCEVGTLSSSRGSTGCIPAQMAQNRYIPFNGSSTDLVCPAQSTSNGTWCLCNKGYYELVPTVNVTDPVTNVTTAVAVASTDGSVTCAACPRGMSGNSSGQASLAAGCAVCGMGKVSRVEGSDTCTLCTAGTYSPIDGGSDCLTCPEGTYSAAGASSCLTCPGGTFALPGSSSCTSCGDGEYAAAGSGRCTECPAGTRAQSGASACDSCPRGFSAARGSKQCTACVRGSVGGTVAPVEGSPSCTACPGGASSDGEVCSCAAGTYMSPTGNECVACPAGTASAVTGATSSATCVPCAAGEHTGGAAGVSACLTCPAGTYTAVNGTGTCTSCPAGTFAGAKSSSCVPCDPGEFSGAAASVCTDCPDRTFASAAGSSQCTTCPENSVSAGTRCDCRAGRYLTSNGTECATCPTGSVFAGQGATAASNCTACALDTVPNAESTACVACPAGAFAGRGAKECSFCPGGSAFNTSSRSCEPCASGTFRPASNDIPACVPCSVGEYAGSTGSLACVKCPAGTSASRPGTSTCDICAPGSFAIEGASACSTCGEGFFNPYWKQSSCSLCPENTATTDGVKCVSQVGYYEVRAEQAPTLISGRTVGMTNSGWPPLSSSSSSSSSSSLSSKLAAMSSSYSKRNSNGTETSLLNTTGGDLNATLLAPAIVVLRAEACKDGANCTVPGIALEEMRAAPGWWRREANADVFFKCPNKKACCPECSSEGCAVGYTGNACGECADGYQKLDTMCIECPRKGMMWVIFFVAVAVQVAVVAVIVSAALKAAEEEELAVAIQGGSGGSGGEGGADFERERKSNLSVVFKILINYLQLSSLVGQLDLQWPDSVTGVLSYMETVSSVGVSSISLECELTFTFYDRVLLMLIMPPVAFVIAVLSWVVITAIKFRGPRGGLRSDAAMAYGRTGIVSTIMVVLFIAHAGLVQTGMHMVTCVDLDDGSYLVKDTSIKCFSGSHTAWVVLTSVVGIALYGIGIPTVAFWLLYRNRETLYTKTVLQRYGFIYRGYVDHRWYWELVTIARKVAVIFVLVFLSQSEAIWQVLAALALVNIVTVVHVASRPFVSKDMQRLELLSLIVTSFTLYSGAMFLSGVEPQSARGQVLTVFVFVVNALLIIMFLVTAIRDVKRTVANHRAEKARALEVLSGERGKNGGGFGGMFQTSKKRGASDAQGGALSSSSSSSSSAPDGTGGVRSTPSIHAKALRAAVSRIDRSGAGSNNNSSPATTPRHNDEQELATIHQGPPGSPTVVIEAATRSQADEEYLVTDITSPGTTPRNSTGDETVGQASDLPDIAPIPRLPPLVPRPADVNVGATEPAPRKIRLAKPIATDPSHPPHSSYSPSVVDANSAPGAALYSSSPAAAASSSSAGPQQSSMHVSSVHSSTSSTLSSSSDPEGIARRRAALARARVKAAAALAFGGGGALPPADSVLSPLGMEDANGSIHSSLPTGILPGNGRRSARSGRRATEEDDGGITFTPPRDLGSRTRRPRTEGGTKD